MHFRMLFSFHQGEQRAAGLEKRPIPRRAQVGPDV